MSTNSKCNFKIIFILYIISSIVLGFYSYTQKKENLIMIQNSIHTISDSKNGLNNSQRVEILKNTEEALQKSLDNLPSHFLFSLWQVLLIFTLYAIFHFFRICRAYIQFFLKHRRLL